MKSDQEFREEFLTEQAQECAKIFMASGHEDPESIVTDYAAALGVNAEDFYEEVRKHLG